MPPECIKYAQCINDFLKSAELWPWNNMVKKNRWTLINILLMLCQTGHEIQYDCKGHSLTRTEKSISHRTHVTKIKQILSGSAILVTVLYVEKMSVKVVHLLVHPWHLKGDYSPVTITVWEWNGKLKCIFICCVVRLLQKNNKINGQQQIVVY